jgi:hypothetical protein
MPNVGMVRWDHPSRIEATRQQVAFRSGWLCLSQTRDPLLDGEKHSNCVIVSQGDETTLRLGKKSSQSSPCCSDHTALTAISGASPFLALATFPHRTLQLKPERALVSTSKHFSAARFTPPPAAHPTPATFCPPGPGNPPVNDSACSSANHMIQRKHRSPSCNGDARHWAHPLGQCIRTMSFTKCVASEATFEALHPKKFVDSERICPMRQLPTRLHG